LIYSSFDPETASLAKIASTKVEKLSVEAGNPLGFNGGSTVLFLTDGGHGHEGIHPDPRRNSMAQAVAVVEEHGLDGVVAHSRAILVDTASAIALRKKGLNLLTYDKPLPLWVSETVGIQGVCVDDIFEAQLEYNPASIPEHVTKKPDNSVVEPRETTTDSTIVDVLAEAVTAVTTAAAHSQLHQQEHQQSSVLQFPLALDTAAFEVAAAASRTTFLRPSASAPAFTKVA